MVYLNQVLFHNLYATALQSYGPDHFAIPDLITQWQDSCYRVVAFGTGENYFQPLREEVGNERAVASTAAGRMLELL